MMTKIKVTCKLAKFQPSWLKLSLKGISLGETIFLVESFLSEQVIYFQVKVYEKKSLENFSLVLLWNSVWGQHLCLQLFWIYEEYLFVFVQILGK